MNTLYKWVVAQLLKPIRPDQPLGPALFNSVARLTLNVAVDAVALRTRAGEVEVFCTKRGVREKAAPNSWHIPGTILRPGEEYANGFRRLEDSELGVAIEQVTLIDEAFTSDRRSSYLQKTFIVRLVGNPKCGSWFDVSDLPSDFCIFHRVHTIPVAVTAYLKNQRIADRRREQGVPALTR